MADDLDAPLPVELDYRVRDLDVRNLTRLKIMRSLADELEQLDAPLPVTWKTSILGDLQRWISRLERELADV